MPELTIRNGFYVGLGLAIVFGTFLLWLWQPDRQVNRHAASLLGRIETRNWTGTASLIGTEYSDQWGNDRPTMLARLGEVFRYAPNAHIMAVDPTVMINGDRATWRARIKIEGGGDEAVVAVKERVNSLSKPFELEWRRVSVRPWDWRLIRVSNPELQIPAGSEQSE